MNNSRKLERRDFLRLTALAAGGTALAACGGGQATAPAAENTPSGRPTAASAPQSLPEGTAPTAPEPTVGGEVVPQPDAAVATPVAAAGNYREAPSLATLVQQGQLPPLEERLPKNPYVVPHEWIKPGKYGGHLQMAYSNEWGVSHFIQESMYGNSPLRYLQDAQAIGPGLVESWSSNDDASEWTLNFREGLKWSDGEPFTTADVMFWWEDMVLNEEHPEGPPDDMRSGTGTIGTLKAVDDLTLMITFDAPAPLTPERLAALVNRGIGAHWIVPKHYMQQFHPKYNPQLKNKKDWIDEFGTKLDWPTNPENPTMSGWMLKSYREGANSVWERNPYYWCVTRNGDQLPYIDGLTVRHIQNPEVLKLNYTEGRVDYMHGGFAPLSPMDYGELKRSEAAGGLQMIFWDSGSGSGSLCFFNYDYAEQKMRELIRNPKFRQALSHAYNREQVRKVVYLNQGETTTGTLSPKGRNFNVNDEGRQVYQQWRDSYIKYDPELAKRMLDEIGAVDKNGDGLREMPDGSPLRITLDYPADTGTENVRKNELLARDWNAIGVSTRLNPVAPTTYADQWTVGKVMTNTAWEIGDNQPLIYPGWVVPTAPEHWAPLHGRMFTLRGTPAEKQQLNVDPYKRTPPRVAPEPGGPIDRLWKLYDRGRVEVDQMKRIGLEWEIFKIHIEEGPWLMGVVANWPRSVLLRKGLMNVPRREDLPLQGWVNTWLHPTPAAYDWEAYYWDDPEQHS